MLFHTLSGLEIFTSFCVLRCGGPFAAVALSLQNLFCCRMSFALDSAGLSKRRSWFFKVDLCSDAASLLHPPAVTFTTLCEYREDSPGYVLRAKVKERRSSIVCRFKERENYRLIYERKRRKNSMPTAKAGARSQASVPRLGLLLSMGAGEANGGRRGWWGQTRLVGQARSMGGRKPPASCPSPPALNTKEATRPKP
jgi:hypothetical protein